MNSFGLFELKDRGTMQLPPEKGEKVFKASADPPLYEREPD
jgi:hypothetical protein